jgi:hypothetical protein
MLTISNTNEKDFCCKYFLQGPKTEKKQNLYDAYYCKIHQLLKAFTQNKLKVHFLSFLKNNTKKCNITNYNVHCTCIHFQQFPIVKY